jgi:FkbM family methyltransferase
VGLSSALDGGPARRGGRAADGQTRVLFVFDHNSVFERKNPTAAITAFQRAFTDRQDVRLVIKSINGERHIADRERLRAAAAGDGRIELIEHYLDRDEVHKLFATADCYLSLHRSEGFGLTVAEAMAHGLPVIATAYSGPGEFLTDSTGWPIPYRLVPVGPGNQPYPADSCWAEPDLDAAAAALREVAGDPDAARRRGLAARRHVLGTRHMELAADWVRGRLTAAYQQWRQAGPSRGTPAAIAPLRESREALRWRADTSAPSRLPGAPALRRAVLRTIDHYDHHQRTVLGSLMDGVERSVTALAGQVERLRADTTSELLRLDGEIGAVRAALTRQLGERARVDGELGKVGGRLAAIDARLGRTDAGLAETGQRIDDLDNRLAETLSQRDRQLGEAVTAVGHLRREWHSVVPAIRQGLLRHHDLLSPPPATPTEAVATDVGVLRLPAADTVVLPWLRTYGTWEVDESRLIDALLPRGGGFVDIGAHVGYFTVRALRLVGDGGFVLAIEPWDVVRELLALNVAANVPAAVASSLVVLDRAAWDADGPLRLSLSAEGNSGDNRIDPGGELEVVGCRLDGLDALAGRRIDVVKSDAQGRDHRALAGLAGLLRVHRPHVLCEFWPDAIAAAGDDPVSVLGQYRALGYRIEPVTADTVSAVQAAGHARVPSADPGRTDRELIELARATGEGFVTLWLRPPA